jgi:hypothetical protein
MRWQDFLKDSGFIGVAQAWSSRLIIPSCVRLEREPHSELFGFIRHGGLVRDTHSTNPPGEQSVKCSNREKNLSKPFSRLYFGIPFANPI